MNPRFLRYYNQELQHLREVGGEFAREYPKIAGRIGLEGFDCADPYVERLLEGFSFLAARIQMKIESEYPRFTQHLSELIYPHFLAPTPSMMVVHMRPDLTNPALNSGFLVPRGSALHSIVPDQDTTACQYRTGHDLTLWPLSLSEAKFFTHSGAQAGLDVTFPPSIKAGLRLRIKVDGTRTFAGMPLDKLCVYIRGSDDMPMRIYEKIFANIESVLVVPPERPAKWHHFLPKTSVTRVGFEEDQALLPSSRRTFQGYRLLQEYFAFPQRFMFFEINGLRAALQQAEGKEVDILILLNRADTQLEQVVDASNFALNCTPAINLFPRPSDRFDVDEGTIEYHVIPNRKHPLDYEVFQVLGVAGYGVGPEALQEYDSFYNAKDIGTLHQSKAFYHIRREKRKTSEKQKRQGTRTSYIGTEVFVSIVDGNNTPYPFELKSVALSLMCTNRDLPLTMTLGVGTTDFLLMMESPVAETRALVGPSEPRASFAEGKVAWRLINHLSLNYLSLVDTDPTQGAVALREMLMLYCHETDINSQRQVEGVRSIKAERVTRRLPTQGPITFGRGLQLTILLDDAMFEGTGAFLMGALLEHFFSQYVSINTFTETIVKTIARGEIMRWPAKSGLCATL
jgi:type VI secretion system protein ImpG